MSPLSTREDLIFRFDLGLLALVAVLSPFHVNVDHITIRDDITESIIPIAALSLAGLLFLIVILGAIKKKALLYTMLGIRLVCGVTLIEAAALFSNYLFASDVQVIGAQSGESKRLSGRTQLHVTLENSTTSHYLKIKNERMFCASAHHKYINLRVREGLLGWQIVEEVYCSK